MRILDADFVWRTVRLRAVYADIAAHGDNAVGGFRAAQIGQHRLQRVSLGDPAEIQLDLRVVLRHRRAVHVNIRDARVLHSLRDRRRWGNGPPAVYVPQCRQRAEGRIIRPVGQVRDLHSGPPHGEKRLIRVKEQLYVAVQRGYLASRIVAGELPLQLRDYIPASGGDFLHARVRELPLRQADCDVRVHAEKDRVFVYVFFAGRAAG